MTRKEIEAQLERAGAQRLSESVWTYKAATVVFTNNTKGQPSMVVAGWGDAQVFPVVESLAVEATPSGLKVGTFDPRFGEVWNSQTW